LSDPLEERLADELIGFVQDRETLFAVADRLCSTPVRLGKLDNSSFYPQAVRAASGMRSMARHLCLLSLYHQTSGHSREALSACEKVLQLAGFLDDRPDAFFTLVRTSLGAIATDALEQTLSRTECAAEDLEALESRLRDESRSINVRASLEQDVRSLVRHAENITLYVAKSTYFAVEQAELTKVLDRRFLRPLEETGIMTESLREELMGGGPPSRRKLHMLGALAWVWSAVCPGAYKLHFAERIQRHLDFCDNLSDEPTERAKQAAAMLAASDKINPDERDWTRRTLAFLDHRALMETAAMGVRAEVYRLRHGSWPDSAGNLGGTWPVDPFDGQPLRYKRTATGCIVYSVGRNLRDDGGEAQEEVMDRSDDIAFRLFDVGLRNR
jgi:hypothetical protein